MSHCDVIHLNTSFFGHRLSFVRVPPAPAPPTLPKVSLSHRSSHHGCLCVCVAPRTRHGGSSRTRRKWPDDSRRVCASLTTCCVRTASETPSVRTEAAGPTTVREELLHLHSREEESPCWSSGRQSVRFCSGPADSFPWTSCVPVFDTSSE